MLIRDLKSFNSNRSRFCLSPFNNSLEKPFFEISGKTWGIIGLGTIGKKVADVASVFGANILYYSTTGRNRDDKYKRSSLENLLKNSDIISIHSPLNEQTFNLIHKENLPLLKDKALLINMGRGGIINEKDLANFIDKSDILVGMDVLESEPMREDNLLLRVKNRDNLFITPHIAWASKEARVRLIKGIEENIRGFLNKI